MARTVRIKWGDQAVTGRWSRLTSPSGPAVLLAHGAGTNQDHPGVTGLRDALVELGHPVLTFNYPYTEHGKGRPDPQARLLACHRAAHDWLAQRTDAIVHAGRSMGGRMATYLVADGLATSGVVLYGYPLHPAGRPEKLRVDHFDRLTMPLLFFSGSRDALALPELVDRWIRPLPSATVRIIDEADHSFRIPKRSGFTVESLRQRMAEETSRWINER